ncbi:endonuclease III [Blattabacterium sp. (Cryptocercus kyebangensis)]|uniref:endonuclease III domain-containing protein n=1 Tax=Blattabacterium sp. (Cryptocercus kyebangensis) TaxID=298656 RepID=UPI000D7BA039|nr:endonuclease III [Blattabacterium sp. (Cryptocercus kyebangensis)]AWU43953.1 endonuclease III [Blattabacterium sp. (Cryptocercus kyebangensis)]
MLETKKKIKIIIDTLDFLYPNPISSLYHINEYTLLLAIMLTSRSKEKKVNELTKHFFKKIQNPQEILKISINDIKNSIKNIGLYNKKAINIYNISNILIDKYHGVIPKNFSELESLPGIGHKSASVFLFHRSKKPVFPVDTHIHRMMFRWKLSNGKNVEQTEKDAKRVFPKKKWKKLHLQIIFYGKNYSPSRRWNPKKDIIYQKLVNNHLL